MGNLTQHCVDSNGIQFELSEPGLTVYQQLSYRVSLGDHKFKSSLEGNFILTTQSVGRVFSCMSHEYIVSHVLLMMALK
jgi:hypothetical protein